MERRCTLIVSDSPDRRYFIEYHLKNHAGRSVHYPNIMSARKAARLDSFALIVVDLSLPLREKLALVCDACIHQSDARIITIGKMEYLEKTGALAGFPSVESIDSIRSFPDKLVSIHE